MGGYKDGYSLLRGIVNQFPELAASGRIDPSRRLVEEHNARVVENADGESQLLFPPQRQTGHQAVAVLGEVETLQKFVGLTVDFVVLHAVDACKQAYVLGNGEVFV